MTGGRLAGGPSCVVTSPGAPVSAVVKFTVAARAAVASPEPGGAVTVQAWVAELPAAMVPAGCGGAGVSGHPAGAGRPACVPLMPPGPAFVTVVCTVTDAPAATVIGVGGSMLRATAADCDRSTGRPPAWVMVWPAFVGSGCVRT